MRVRDTNAVFERGVVRRNETRLEYVARIRRGNERSNGREIRHHARTRPRGVSRVERLPRVVGSGSKTVSGMGRVRFSSTRGGSRGSCGSRSQDVRVFSETRRDASDRRTIVESHFRRRGSAGLSVRLVRLLSMSRFQVDTWGWRMRSNVRGSRNERTALQTKTIRGQESDFERLLRARGGVEFRFQRRARDRGIGVDRVRVVSKLDRAVFMVRDRFTGTEMRRVRLDRSVANVRMRRVRQTRTGRRIRDFDVRSWTDSVLSKTYVRESETRIERLVVRNAVSKSAHETFASVVSPDTPRSVRTSSGFG